MEPFVKVSGVVAPVDWVNVDEDSEGNVDGYGQWVQLRHDDDSTFTRYAHLMFGSTVRQGQRVVQGEVIALSNATGADSDGNPVPAHLHFEYLDQPIPDEDLRATDPLPCLEETPFSGVWVGSGPFALYSVSDPHGIIGGGAGPPRLGRVESSRWVLRQTADGVVGTGKFTATGGLSEELGVELGETPPEFVVFNEYPRFNLANVNPPLSTTFPFVPLDLTIVSVGGTIIQATPAARVAV